MKMLPIEITLIVASVLILIGNIAILLGYLL